MRTAALWIALYISNSLSYVITPMGNTTLDVARIDSPPGTDNNDQGLNWLADVSSKDPGIQSNTSALTARNEVLNPRTQVNHRSCAGVQSAELEQILSEVGRWSRLSMRASDFNRDDDFDMDLLKHYFVGRRGYITENEHRIIYSHYMHLHAEIRGRPMNRDHREVEITCDELDPRCNEQRGRPLSLHQNHEHSRLNVCSPFWNLPRSIPRFNRRLGNYDQVQYMLGALTQCRSVYHRPTQLDAPNPLDDTRKYRNFAKELSIHYGRENPPSYGIASRPGGHWQ